ncbi:MAG: glycosyltransferase family 2 protein [Candidatus Omnitrophica bacterium]|nr:glycosyltransferase family 2 protein [Candidatus Omnitrophota bacterium]
MNSALCDIIVLTLNQPDVLKPCVDSVLKHTKIPSRLIVVNNGGGKRIRDLFVSFKETPQVSLKLLEFPENIGFVRGNNAAVAGGNSKYVCLLNNDCIVTPGWLERMIDLAERNPKFAAVNPQCNTLIDHDAVRNLPLEECARYFERFRGEYYVLGSVIGFCMLIPRKVIGEIGLFNEEIDTAYFEDSDFSYRARAAGYECVLAADAYVYHQPFGKASSISMKRRQALIQKNRQWFESKWGKAVRMAIVYDCNVGNDAELKLLLEQMRKMGIDDNHPHLILNTRREGPRNFDALLRAFQMDRSKSPNLKATIMHSPFFRLFAVLRIGFKWRKRYDAVASNNPDFLRWLGPFRYFLKFWTIYVTFSASLKQPVNFKSPDFIDCTLDVSALGDIRKEMRDAKK